MDGAKGGNNSLFCAGLIIAPHGINGIVKIKSFMTNPLDIAAYGKLLDKNGVEKFGVENVSVKNGAIILAKINGVNSRKEAESLRNAELFISKESLPKTANNEFYHIDLIGLKVQDTNSKLIGVVKHVHDYGAGGMLEIELTQKGDKAASASSKNAVKKAIDLKHLEKQSQKVQNAVKKRLKKQEEQGGGQLTETIPFSNDFIKEVSIEKGYITIEIPEYI